MTYLGIKKIQIIPKSIKIKSDRFILLLTTDCVVYIILILFIFFKIKIKKQKSL